METLPSRVKLFLSWEDSFRLMKSSFLYQVKDRLSRVRRSFFFIGLLSLLWLIFRSGTKPSRITYPCQRAAAVNVQVWFALYVAPLLSMVGSKVSRRRFKVLAVVVLSVVVVVGSVAVWRFIEYRKAGRVLELKLEGFTAEAEPSSDIFVVVGTTGYDGGFQRLISLMGEHGLRFYKSSVEGRNMGPDGLIGRDDVVLIKVNSQWDERGGTNTDLLRAIIEAVVNHPDGFVGEIVVADNGQAQYGSSGRGGSLDWTHNNAEDHSQSVEKVVEMFSGSYKVSAYLWDEITLKEVAEYCEGDMRDGYVVNRTANPRTGIMVSYPKFRTKFGTYISFKMGVWDPEKKSYDPEKLKVINVPVLKSHSIYGVTACVKHYMGVVSDKLTGHNAHMSVGTGGMGTEMAETRFPTLNVLDAVWVNPHPRGGPRTSYSEAVRVNVIAASLDPIALDYWASKYILMKAATMLGYTDLSSMDPDNTGRGSFGEWLRLSMEELLRAGYQVTVDERHMNVYVAVHRSS